MPKRGIMSKKTKKSKKYSRKSCNKIYKNI